MTRITFSHLFSLSLSYHTRRKTGEITKIISRGAVVDELIDNFLLFIGPAYVDLVIAAAFFRWMYGWSLALIMFALEIFYGEYLCHILKSLWTWKWLVAVSVSPPTNAFFSFLCDSNSYGSMVGWGRWLGSKMTSITWATYFHFLMLCGH